MGPVVVLAALGMLVCGCGNTAAEERRSFVDRNGRICSYVLVTESDDEEVDLDVSDLDCDFPTPAASPSR